MYKALSAKIGILFCFLPLVLSGQSGNIPIGTWRFHSNLNKAKAVEIVDDKIYCGSNGGLFYLDTDDSYKITHLTKLDGLNDVSVSALRYSPATKALVVAYQSGNIDIIKNGTIYNLPFILNANITGSLSINHVALSGNNAILSCAFGVVVINLDKVEIKESYLNIGANGSSPVIYCSAASSDSIYLGTSQGLLSANANGNNLMDFRSWNKIKISDSLANIPVKYVAVYQNKPVVAYDNTGIYGIKNDSWSKILSSTFAFKQLKAENDNLYVSTPVCITKYNNGTATDLCYGSISFINDFKSVPGKEDEFWIADDNFSLYSYKSQNVQNWQLNAPVTSSTFKLRSFDNQTFSLSGGYNFVTAPQLVYGAFSVFENGSWNNSYPYYSGVPNINDLVDVAIDKSRSLTLLASAWNGLVIKNNTNGQYTIINDSTPGCNLHNDYGVRVTGVYYDASSSSSWFCNIGSFQTRIPTIFRLKDNSTCDSYTFPFVAASYPVQIIVDNFNNKWVRLNNAQGGGILVFNEETMTGNTPQYVYITDGSGSGNLPSITVNAMAKDRNGDIWMGTGKGVCIFYSSGYTLSSGNINASVPIVNGYGLLFDQVVTAIDVDGGNRKWIGTTNGLYLFSPDGLHTIRFFNTGNSPLPSDNIVDVSVNQQSGEVFIATDKGLVAYREAATAGLEEQPSDINIFPNPVKTNYNGQIGFAGLATDAIVKITDISGQLVYQTKANGGTVSWNGRDYNNKKITAGVYVVLASKEDGELGIAGKIFVVD